MCREQAGSCGPKWRDDDDAVSDDIVVQCQVAKGLSPLCQKQHGKISYTATRGHQLPWSKQGVSMFKMAPGASLRKVR